MKKLSLEGINYGTAAAILEFFNRAKSPYDLTGRDPNEEPEAEEMNVRFEGTYTEYSIKTSLAQRILAKRKSLPGGIFTELRQLEEVKGFSQNLMDDLVFSFRVA